MPECLNFPDPNELYQRYKNSEYGRRLVLQSRFGAPNMMPEWMTAKDWTLLLGPDVNNLWHLSHSIHVATMYEILSQGKDPHIPEQYSVLATLYPHKYALLQGVAGLHDIQEVITGDTNYHDKTTETEQEEEREFVRMMGELYSDYFSQKAILELADITFRQDNPLGFEFQAIEEIGYLMTALQAHYITNGSLFYNHSMNERDDLLLSDGRDKLAYLVCNVTHTALPHLIAKGKVNNGVRTFLINSVPDIDRMVESQSNDQDLIIAWKQFKTTYA